MSLTLTRIAHNGPVTMRQLGHGHAGIVWTVHPRDFDSLIAWVNANGGPSMYAIDPIACPNCLAEEFAELHDGLACETCGEYV